MKHGFRQGDIIVLEFWLGEVYGKFTTPSLNLENGKLLIMLLMQQLE
jgi:hypothetical protein